MTTPKRLSPATTNPLDTTDFKNAMGSFLTGVAVVVMRDANSFRGITVSSVASVSLEPPLFSFCVEQEAKSYTLLQAGDAISLNILSQNQQDLCLHFAKNGDDWREAFSNTLTTHSIPLLTNTVAGIGATIQQRIIAGDHDIVVCQVEDIQVNETQQPLAYFRGEFPSLRL